MNGCSSNQRQRRTTDDCGLHEQVAELNIKMTQTTTTGDPDVYVRKDQIPDLQVCGDCCSLVSQANRRCFRWQNWDRREATISLDHVIAYRITDRKPLTPG